MKAQLKPVCLDNRLASLVYKIILIVVCLVGLIINMGLVNGTFAPYVLLYYTIQCNLLVLIFFAVGAVVTGLAIHNTGNEGPVRMAPHFKGAVVMSTILASIIYFFLLANTPFAAASIDVQVSNIVVNLIVPLMVVADWALFDKKGVFKPSDPIIWMVIPFMYYAIVLVAAQLQVQYYGGVHYPYTFINPDLIRWAPVLVNIFFIVGGYLAASYLFFGIDKLVWYLPNREALKAMAEARAAKAGAAAEKSDDGLYQLNDLVNLGSGQPDMDTAAPIGAQPAGAPAAGAALGAAATAAAAQPAAVQPAAPAQTVLNPQPQAAPAQTAAVPPAASQPQAAPAARAPIPAPNTAAGRPSAQSGAPYAPAAPSAPTAADLARTITEAQKNAAEVNAPGGGN